jgi:hypothetical protein
MRRVGGNSRSSRFPSSRLLLMMSVSRYGNLVEKKFGIGPSLRKRQRERIDEEREMSRARRMHGY